MDIANSVLQYRPGRGVNRVSSSEGGREGGEKNNYMLDLHPPSY